MNVPVAPPSSPATMVNLIGQYRGLIWQMTRREVIGRYKGSIFGLAWSFFNPLIMLAVYTFVFSVVFEARWGIQSVGDSQADFALTLFAGLLIHALFAEVLNRAPTLVLHNVNYVKKVVFPLEILVVVTLGAALFHALISIIVLLFAFFILHGQLNWTVIYTPFTLLPLLPLALGLGWVLASLGVYLRDIGQMIGAVTTMLLFLSPVFYPVSALPEIYQAILYANPLTYPIEQTRAVIIFGQIPNWTGLGIYCGCSVVICWIGFWWFQKTRQGFADVI